MASSTTQVIDGVEVTFPFKPYDIQIEYMRRVIKCCKEGENGLLESPTGTGKTLSLLCSSLAWLSEEKEKATKGQAEKKAKKKDDGQESASQSEENGDQETRFKVVYASRTHKQLQQAMKEMKRTVYADNLLAVCLASRDQYCVNSDVRSAHSLTEKNDLCRERRTTRDETKKCVYFRKPVGQGSRIGDYADVLSSLLEDSLTIGQKGAVVDIEDLTKAGLSHSGCPYYAAQYATSVGSKSDAAADVVFCPYNYVFSRSVSLNLKNAVLIFDEGHNIEKTCEESASASISTFTLNQCISGLMQVMEEDKMPAHILDIKKEQKYKSLTVKALDQLVRILEKMCAAINSKAVSAGRYQVEKSSDDADPQPVCKPPVVWLTGLILDGLKSTVSDEDMTGPVTVAAVESVFFEVLKQTIDFVQASGFKVFHIILKNAKKDETKFFVSALNALIDFLKAATPVSPAESRYSTFMKDNYRASITRIVPQEEKRTFPRPTGFQLDLFCLNPAVAIKKIFGSGVRSIVITSGTLAPMTTFEAELDVKFKYKLSNPHVVEKNQLLVYQISRFEDMYLDGSYKATLNNPRYYQLVGEAVLRYIESIPDGVLIFFKSYASLRISMEQWTQLQICEKIQKRKKFFHEPRDKRNFAHVLDEYKRHIDSDPSGRKTGETGAILTAVFRGKISEGLDLADQYCRGVIVIGLPFPNWKDPHVELKREFLDAKKDSRLSKDQWYDTEMLRAVNQAVGRIVRHRDDYGVVLLIDAHFQPRMRSLSVWLQKFICESTVQAKRLADFFKLNERRGKIIARSHDAVRMESEASSSGIKRSASSTMQQVVTLSDDDDEIEVMVKSETSKPPVWSKPGALQVQSGTFKKIKSSDSKSGTKTESSESFPSTPIPSTSSVAVSSSHSAQQDDDEIEWDDAFDEIEFPALSLAQAGPSSSGIVHVKQEPVARGETDSPAVRHAPDSESDRSSEVQQGAVSVQVDDGVSRSRNGVVAVPMSRASERGDGNLMFPPSFLSTPSRVGSQEFWNVGSEFKQLLDDSVIQSVGENMCIIDEAISGFRSNGDVHQFIREVKRVLLQMNSKFMLPLVQNLCKFVNFSSESDKKVFIEHCIIIPASRRSC